MRPTEPAGLPPLTVGYRDPGGAAPLLLVAAKGEPSGIRFRLAAKRYASDGKLASALRSGEVTMAVMPISEAAALYVDRVPVIVVGATAESFGRDGIVSTGPVDTLDEFSGRRVAVSSSTGAFFVWSMMTRAGLEPASVTVQTRPYRELEGALAGGETEGAVLSGTALGRAKQAADQRVLLTTEDFPGLLTDVVVVGSGFADENAREVQKVLDALAAAAEELGRDAGPSREAAAREASMTAAQLAAAGAGLRYLVSQDVRDLLGVAGSPGALAQVAGEAVEFQIERMGAQTPPEASGFVDTRFANPAEQ